jgi:Putative quorum-sensing-regulated virulence factor
MERMTFGKHQGERVCDVPTGYLLWVLGALHSLNPRLRFAIEAELRRREYAEHQPQRAPGPERPQPQTYGIVDLKDVVQRWYRVLALHWHPDRGGSADAMKTVNDAHERLRKLLGV